MPWCCIALLSVSTDKWNDIEINKLLSPSFFGWHLEISWLHFEHHDLPAYRIVAWYKTWKVYALTGGQPQTRKQSSRERFQDEWIDGYGAVGPFREAQLDKQSGRERWNPPLWPSATGLSFVPCSLVSNRVWHPQSKWESPSYSGFVCPPWLLIVWMRGRTPRDLVHH